MGNESPYQATDPQTFPVWLRVVFLLIYLLQLLKGSCAVLPIGEELSYVLKPAGSGSFCEWQMVRNIISGLSSTGLLLQHLCHMGMAPSLTMVTMTVPFPHIISTNFAPLWANGLDTNPAGN